MSNFAQYVFRIPEAQGPIVATLSLKWDGLSASQRTLTQVEMRRALGMMHTPAKVTIEFTHPQYSTILALGESSAAHVARFEEMANTAKANRAARKLISSIADILKG